MGERTVYEHLERDLDGCYYWFMNRDVGVDRFPPIEIIELRKWFYEQQFKFKDTSLYYKGTRLYFTYKNLKYYLSWVFYSQSLIDDTVARLRSLGATNIQINYGELD